MLNGVSAAAKSLVPSTTGTPPARAGLVSVAVPLTGVPAVTVSRSTRIDSSGIFDTDTDGFTVNTPAADALPNVAVTRTLAVVERFALTNENMALVSPAKRVTPDGIDTAPGLSLASGTNTDAAVAVDRLTRPMPPSPPFTVDGWNVTELSAIGGAACTVSGALTTTSSSAAKKVTVCVSGCPRVKAVNVPVVAPPAIAPNDEPTSATDASLL